MYINVYINVYQYLTLSINIYHQPTYSPHTPSAPTNISLDGFPPPRQTQTATTANPAKHDEISIQDMTADDLELGMLVQRWIQTDPNTKRYTLLPGHEFTVSNLSWGFRAAMLCNLQIVRQDAALTTFMPDGEGGRKLRTVPLRVVSNEPLQSPACIPQHRHDDAQSK